MVRCGLFRSDINPAYILDPRSPLGFLGLIVIEIITITVRQSTIHSLFVNYPVVSR